jgi:CMP/dCMP kinase
VVSAPLVVTISGRPGSGKSTVAKALARAIGAKHASAGDFMREMAAERGISVLELSHVAESDASIDWEIDARSARLGATAEDLVIDSRLAWHFIPSSYKVFLDVDLDVAVQRIYGDRRGSELENVDLASTRRSTEERARSEALRYQAFYGIDYLDPANYDLVIDSSHRSVDQIVGEIVSHIGQ